MNRGHLDITLFIIVLTLQLEMISFLAQQYLYLMYSASSLKRGWFQLMIDFVAPGSRILGKFSMLQVIF